MKETYTLYLFSFKSLSQSILDRLMRNQPPGHIKNSGQKLFVLKQGGLKKMLLALGSVSDKTRIVKRSFLYLG